MINVSLCLSDIPKEFIKTSESNGKKYLSITVSERQEVDRFGNTHTVSINKTKEQREADNKKVYIGSGKKVELNPQPASATPVASDAPGANFYNPSPENVDDLPF